MILEVPRDDIIFIQQSGDHRDLHSFPTRRSSDLIFGHASNGRSRPVHRAGGTASPAFSGDPGSCRTDRAATATGNTATTCRSRSEEHTSELQSRLHLVCRLLLEKKKKNTK